MSDGKSRGADSPHLQLDFLSGQDRAEHPDAPRVRVSSRARRLSIRVYPDARVEVVVPPRVRPREVEQFVSVHREWIEARRVMALRNRPVPQPFPPAEIELRMTSERLRLHLAGGTGAPRVGAGDQILRVTGAAPAAKLRRALRTWLLRAARERLAPRVAVIAQAMGVEYSQVSVRRQRSRWGSCSARGTISLNCCLLFQRPEVVDYLIVHELTHVRHMNHSARFWQAVERHCAGWRELDRELVQGWRQVPRWVFSEE